jgi:hypothetical protein
MVKPKEALVLTSLTKALYRLRFYQPDLGHFHFANAAGIREFLADRKL